MSKNIRYKLIPLSELQPRQQTQIDASIRAQFDSLVGRGKDYESAQEIALRRNGCEVIFDGDDAIVCKRIGIIAETQNKRSITHVREGVVRSLAQ